MIGSAGCCSGRILFCSLRTLRTCSTHSHFRVVPGVGDFSPIHSRCGVRQKKRKQRLRLKNGGKTHTRTHTHTLKTKTRYRKKSALLHVYSSRGGGGGSTEALHNRAKATTP